MHTPTTTSILQPPIATEWVTHIHASGVSIQYPANWQVDTQAKGAGYDIVHFEFPTSTLYAPVRFEIYNRALGYRDTGVFYDWLPTGSGYDTRWSKPISIDTAEGLEFVWGAYSDGQWDARPTLNAIYYGDELDIGLGAFLDDESIELIETSGFAETISSRFSLFEHMVESVRIPTPTPVVSVKFWAILVIVGFERILSSKLHAGGDHVSAHSDI